VLKWFGSKGSTIEELIERKKYAPRGRGPPCALPGRTPDVALRQQLAEVLILAGKQKEAVPIIIGLADEYAFDGQAAKAIALLKKLELLKEGPPEVEGAAGRAHSPQGDRQGRPGHPPCPRRSTCRSGEATSGPVDSGPDTDPKMSVEGLRARAGGKWRTRPSRASPRAPAAPRARWCGALSSATSPKPSCGP
jgi:hypothetical protein